MSRSSAQKAIHYVRAVYGKTKPKEPLEKALRAVLQHMPHAGDTEIEHPTLGTLSIRFRNAASQHGLFLAIGQGVEGEAMATIGLHVQAESDVESPVPPVEGRAFKLADAFCLIDENELLICTDGGLRMQSTSYYIRKLLEKGNAPNASQSMDFMARLNQDKANVLASGIKSIKIVSSAYRASQILEGNKGTAWTRKGLGNLLKFIRSAFEETMEDDAKREALVNHESEIVVSTEINIKGGMRGEEVLLNAIDSVGKDAITDMPDGADIIITAAAGTVSSTDVILKRGKSIKRRSGQNGLDHADAWDKLAEYRLELIDSKLWKK